MDFRCFIHHVSSGAQPGYSTQDRLSGIKGQSFLELTTQHSMQSYILTQGLYLGAHESLEYLSD